MSGAEPVEDCDDSTIFPDHLGRVAVFLDKEALLARLTDTRSQRKEAIVDRFFFLSRARAFYFTDIYVISELLGTVRSGSTAEAAIALMDDLESSTIEVHHGPDRWDESTLTQSPKEVFEAGTDLIRQAKKHDVKFNEASLVMQAITAEKGCIFSYDKPVRGLARAYDLDVFPYLDDCWLP